MRLIAFLVPLTLLGQGVTVTTSQGALKGSALNDGGAVFKSIPFAQPPVGDLRWKEPQTPKAWTGIRDATQFAASCAQIDAGWNTQAAKTGSEDCLYLNLWTAEWPSKQAKPVMVWFHGGGNQAGTFMGGGGIEPSFDGERFARRGVVLITAAYRLGVLGFFAHPELTEESPHHSSGNYATQDQIAVLRWVKENVARFGGDPNNVTIFGQSAGAHNVGLLMASPQARGLFHKAIGESGSVIIRGALTRTRQSLENAGVQFAAKLNAPSKGSIKYLRTLSTADILKAAPDYNGRGDDRPEPDIDGYAITKLPAEVFRAHEEAPVPLIIGNNARERTVAGGADGLKKEMSDYYGPLTAKAAPLYAGSDGYAPHGDPNAQFATDQQFRCAATTIAQWHAVKFPTYEYEFSRAPEPRGSVHSWEMQFVFGNLKQATEPMDRTISDQMQTYWTNFAKTGNPNGAGLPNWPLHDASKKSYMDFTPTGPAVKEALRAAQCDLFRERLSNEMAKK